MNDGGGGGGVHACAAVGRSLAKQIAGSGHPVTFYFPTDEISTAWREEEEEAEDRERVLLKVQERRPVRGN